MDPQSLTIERLPMLRTLVLIDNTDEGKPEMRRLNMRCFMDWRDIPVWCEGAEHALAQKQIEANIKKDDVVTLQFTRSAHGQYQSVVFFLTNYSCSGTTGYPKAASVSCQFLFTFHVVSVRSGIANIDSKCGVSSWTMRAFSTTAFHAEIG